MLDNGEQIILQPITPEYVREVRGLLKGNIEAHQNGAPLMMSVVNAGELWYNTVRGHSHLEADRVIQELGNLGIEMVEADWEITKQAATLKTKGKLAYTDCFAAALARLRKAEVVTGDPEFKQLDEEVKILWV